MNTSRSSEQSKYWRSGKEWIFHKYRSHCSTTIQTFVATVIPSHNDDNNKSSSEENY